MARLPGTFDPDQFTDDAPTPFDGLPDLAAIVELRAHRQWVAWAYEDRGGPKLTKVPKNPRTGANAASNTAATWGTCEEAERRATRDRLAGVGFVLTAGDDYIGIDLDDVVDERGTLATWAAEIVGWGETYTELSPSRRGIRMIARGEIPKATKAGDVGVEIYASGRYVTITGDHMTGTPEDIRPAPRTIAALNRRAEAAKAKSTTPEPQKSGEKQLLERVQTTTPITDNPRLAAYIDQAFKDEIAGVATAGKGARNNQLNQAAFSLYQMVAAGWVTAADVQSALVEAATQSGLVADDGMPSVLKTITSGRAAGMRNPREVPREIAEDHENAEMGASIVAGLKRGERIDPETGEITEIGNPISEQKQGVGRAKRILPFVIASSWAGKKAPPRQWMVDGWIPANKLTLITGDGATGKSTIGLQLCAAVATGGTWFGERVPKGRALFVTSEDEEDEVERRIEAIEEAGDVKIDELHNLAITSLENEDAVLASLQPKLGKITPTELFEALREKVLEWRPNLLILDPIADLFGGNENDKPQVITFIKMLKGLIKAAGELTIVLFGHPSVSGINSGTGTSGNVAWGNSVRSRLYWTRVFDENGNQPDPDVRMLTNMKQNYSRQGGKLYMRWSEGRFVLDGKIDGGAIDAQAERDRIDDLFLSILSKLEGQNRFVNANAGTNYAPSVFAQDPDAKGVGKRGFAAAMNRLFDAGMIRNVDYGPPSTKRTRVTRATEYDLR